MAVRELQVIYADYHEAVEKLGKLTNELQEGIKNTLNHQCMYLFVKDKRMALEPVYVSANKNITSISITGMVYYNHGQDSEGMYNLKPSQLKDIANQVSRAFSVAEEVWLARKNEEQ